MQSIQTGRVRVGCRYSSTRRSTVILCLLEYLLGEKVLCGVGSLASLGLSLRLSLLIAALHSKLLLVKLLRSLWAGAAGLNLVLCGESGLNLSLLNHLKVILCFNCSLC